MQIFVVSRFDDSFLSVHAHSRTLHLNPVANELARLSQDIKVEVS